MAVISTKTIQILTNSASNDVVSVPAGEIADGTFNDYQIILAASGGNDTLTGFSGPANWPNFAASGDTALGLNVFNSLSGDDGNDTLIQSLGFTGLPVAVAAIYTHMDSMIGGDGDDTYVLRRGGFVIDEAYKAGTDTVVLNNSFFTSTDSNSFDMAVSAANVENARLSATAVYFGSVDINGNALDNVITGNGAENIFYGAEGFDKLYGGAGNDTLIGGADRDTLYGGLGNDILTGFGVFLMEDDGAASLLYGGSGNDTLTGGTGNDVLDGGTGNDAMAGDLGNDVYTVDSMDDTVTDAGGTDTVQSGTIDLQGSDFSDIEVLRLIGTAALDIASNGNATTLLGNAGANEIYGSLTVGKDEELRGGAGDDSLYGYGGNDLLGGGAGNDVLEGGLGDDTMIVDSGDDQVIEAAAGGTDTVRTAKISLDAADYANIETLELAGLQDLNLTGGDSVTAMFGNDGANLITAGAGAELIDAGAGNDTLVGFIGNGEDAIVDNDTVYGGSGDDTYIVTDATDALVIFERFGSLNGRDTVQLGYGNGIAADFANFEVLQLIGSDNFDLTGGGTIVELIGNAGSNQIGGNGNISELISGGDGADALYGGLGESSDTLVGGTGNDDMFGRDGGDFFVFSDADVGTGGSTDNIYDFEHTLDKIDLSSTLVAFATSNGIYVAEAGPQITFSKGPGSLFYAVNMDLDGDGDTDLSVQVFTSLLDGNDFIFSDSIIS